MTAHQVAKLTFISSLVGLMACGGADRDRTPGTANQGTDAGSQNSGDGLHPDDDPALTEFGRGEYAIYLTEQSPRRYCWYIEETVRICGGGGRPTRSDSFRNVCFDDETNCLARQPEDSERETSSCWTRIDYDNVSSGALYGDCGKVTRYFAEDDTVQCLYHRHCRGDRLCVDYQCVCPPGVDCGCTACPPAQPARCEGDVLITQTQGEGCDENGACVINENREDCAASNAACNAETEACEGGSGGTDAGQPDATPGPDAGTTPDAGTAPDAGCQCPPLAPPRCEGDTVVSQTCDPSDCALGQDILDCTSFGQICDPVIASCVEDVECRVAADCPTPGPTPIGICVDVSCTDNVCVETTRSC